MTPFLSLEQTSLNSTWMSNWYLKLNMSKIELCKIAPPSLTLLSNGNHLSCSLFLILRSRVGCLTHEATDAPQSYSLDPKSENHPWCLPPYPFYPKNPTGSFLKIYPGSNHFLLPLWPPYWSSLSLAWTIKQLLFLCPSTTLPLILDTEIKVNQNSSQTMLLLYSKHSQIFQSYLE